MKKKYKYLNIGLIHARALRDYMSGAFALIIMCSPLHAGTEDAGIERFAWNWSEGQVRSYRLELDRTQRTIAENSYRTEFSLRCDLVFFATKAETDQTRLNLVLRNITITASNADHTRRFNSATPPEEPVQGESNPWAIAGLTIMGNTIEIEFSSCGTIIITKGLQIDLEQDLRLRKDASPRERFEILQIFGDDGLTNMLNSIFSILPEDHVFTDEWSRVRSVDLATGISIQKREHYEVRASTGDTLDIDMRAELLMEDGEVKEVNLPQGSIAVNVGEFGARSTTQFSRSQGCVINQHNRGTMKLDMSISGNTLDEQEDAASELRQTTRLRLLPQNTNEERR